MNQSCRNDHSPRFLQRGVTLLELMTALAVIGITAAAAAPAFTDLVKNQRITTAANELLTSLSLARSSAMTTRVQSVVCPSANATSDAPACGGSWQGGWIVFSDINGDGDPNPPRETIWEQHPALGGKVQIGAPGMIAQRVRFQPMGTARGFNGTFAICDDRSADTNQRRNMREVVVAFAGRVRVLPGDGDTACP